MTTRIFQRIRQAITRLVESLPKLHKPVVMSRRQRESNNDFALLRIRLDRENQLHALMLSQRHFRKSL